MNNRTNTRIFVLPQTLLGRVLASIVAALLFVSAFFFLFLFLIVAGVLILGYSLRLLWRARRDRNGAAQEIIEGEYTVEPAEKPAEIKHND